MKFKAFNLKRELTDALEALGYKDLTSVQEKTIPLALKGESLLVRSETGSGKTHSFLIPIINKINLEDVSLQSLIIAPTRELAMQIYDFAIAFKKYFPNLNIKLFSGGTERTREEGKLKVGAHIIIGTPGRLADLISNTSLDTTLIKSVVIDEADLSCEMGYLEDINKILDRTKNPQIMVFSATYPLKLKQDLSKYLKIDKIIEVGKSKTAGKVVHYAIDKKHTPIEEATLDFIKTNNPYFVMIFASKKETVKEIYEYLMKNGIKCGILHGDMEARERKSMFKRIKSNEFSVVVCSDMASRGMDFDDVTTVLNIDLPKDLSFYFHRAGRTGRNNKSGECYTFYNVDDQEGITKLQQMGVSFVYMTYTKEGFKLGKATTKKKKYISPEKKELDKKIKIAVSKARSKKVKPNHKKKMRLAAEKIKKKHKREIIKKDIRRQREERYKAEANKWKE